MITDSVRVMSDDAGLKGFDTDSTDSQFVNDRVIRIWINSVGLKVTPDKQQQSYNPRSTDQASPFTSIGKQLVVFDCSFVLCG